MERGRSEVDAQYAEMIAHEVPEYRGTILDESTDSANDGYVGTLHHDAYEEKLAQEREFSAERSPEDCAKMVEGAAIGVMQLRGMKMRSDYELIA
jgi:hypothetical protein